MGGVSPLLGLEPVLFRERVHRLTVYTLFEGTSSAYRRGWLATGALLGATGVSRVDDRLQAEIADHPISHLCSLWRRPCDGRSERKMLLGWRGQFQLW